jgi:hypothetical protein
MRRKGTTLDEIGPGVLRLAGQRAYPEPGADHCDGKLQKMENTSGHSRIVRTKLSARTRIDREPTLGIRATGKQQTHTRRRILAGLSQLQHKEKHVTSDPGEGNSPGTENWGRRGRTKPAIRPVTAEAQQTSKDNSSKQNKFA